ncbi:MAG: hypothetical protein WB783_20845 [Arenicellales bacterium]|jgi:hypothetical protein
MTDIVRLADNFIGKEDRLKLESFGGHSIAHGRATRWHWSTDEHGGDVFEIYRGGADEELAYRVSRDRREDVFRLCDAGRRELLSGELEHVLAGLEQMLATGHGESLA